VFSVRVTVVMRVRLAHLFSHLFRALLWLLFGLCGFSETLLCVVGVEFRGVCLGGFLFCLGWFWVLCGGCLSRVLSLWSA